MKRLTVREALLQMRAHPMHFLSLIIGLSAVLAIGPHVQTYVVDIITSQEPSIYSSAYSNALTLYPALEEWILSAWSPAFIFLSALIIIYALQELDTRSIFINCWASSFFVLTVTDISTGIFYRNFSVTMLAENALSNFIGGPIICSVLILFLVVPDLLDQHLRDHGILKHVTQLLFPALCGLLCLIASYYLITLFYNPTRSNIKLEATAPTSGYYSSADLRWPRATEEEKSDSTSFSIFSKPAQTPDLLTWNGGAKSFETTWSKSSQNIFDITISAHNGCGVYKLKDGIVDNNSIYFSDIKQMSIKVDDGYTDVRLGRDTSEAGYFRLADEKYGMYWLQNSDKEGKYKIATFLDEKSKVTYWNPTGDLKIDLAMMLVKDEKVAPRQITFLIDGNQTTLRFAPDREAKWNDKIDCNRIDLKNSHHSQDFTTTLLSVVSIRLTPRDRTIALSDSRSDKDPATITGLNGWLIADELDKRDLPDYFSAGHLGMISFQGGVSSLVMNDASITLSNDDSIILHYGDLDASVSDEAGLQVTGNASAIYKNGSRLNRTRWERLDWPARLIIFGGIPGSLIWFANLIIGLLRQNRKIQFIS